MDYKKLNYVFFINNSNSNYNDKNGAKNDFENWQKGLSEMDTCSIFTADEEQTREMLDNKTYTLNKHIECVSVPELELDATTGKYVPCKAAYSKDIINAYIHAQNFDGDFSKFTLKFQDVDSIEIKKVLDNKKNK